MKALQFRVFSSNAISAVRGLQSQTNFASDSDISIYLLYASFLSYQYRQIHFYVRRIRLDQTQTVKKFTLEICIIKKMAFVLTTAKLYCLTLSYACNDVWNPNLQFLFFTFIYLFKFLEKQRKKMKQMQMHLYAEVRMERKEDGSNQKHLLDRYCINFVRFFILPTKFSSSIQPIYRSSGSGFKHVTKKKSAGELDEIFSVFYSQFTIKKEKIKKILHILASRDSFVFIFFTIQYVFKFKEGKEAKKYYQREEKNIRMKKKRPRRRAKE